MTEPQTAAHWDELYRRYIDEGVFEQRRREMQPAWVALLDLFYPPDAVLEVGCGTGLFLAFLQDRAAIVLQPAGADISPQAIHMAQKRIPEGDFRVYDAAAGEPLPWPDCSFDTVFSGHTIEHVADPVVMLREMLRVTKLGGQIIIEFPHLDPPYVEHIHSMLNYAQVSEWMEAAGIEIVECRPVIEMQPTNDGVVVGRRAT